MSNTQSDGAIAEKLRPTPLKKPSQWSVIFFNDDVTTMDFVVSLLIDFFDKDFDNATDLMLTIHLKGSAVVGIYSKDIAETKRYQALQRCQEENFPLRIEIEEVK